MKIPVRKKDKDQDQAVPVEPSPKVRKLTLMDRCDRCGAQAFVRVATEPQPLLFCGHHYRKHEPAVQAAGYEVLDEREWINAKPSMAAS